VSSVKDSESREFSAPPKMPRERMFGGTQSQVYFLLADPSDLDSAL
jgi:hypothetical protein